MNPTLKRILVLLGLAVPIFGPAWNITVEELKDRYDASASTVFQAELLIDAWFGAIKECALAAFVWANRNSLVNSHERPAERVP